MKSFKRLSMQVWIPVALLVAAGPAMAQESVGRKPVVATPGDQAQRGVLSLAVTFDAAAANITTGNSFWLNGGSMELNGELGNGLGITASVDGLHTADSGGGVPVNLVVATFGPSYTRRFRADRQEVSLFAHGLVGEADGFRGLYPHTIAPTTNSIGLAIKAGGGVDLRLGRHISLRLLEADWLRTQLPNAASNVQNDVRLGAGIVFRSASR